MSQIKFKNKTTALGRNGISFCVGLDLFSYSRINKDNRAYQVVELSPINSQGNVTKCYIEIDMEAVPELIKQLQSLYDKSKTNPRVP